MFEQDHMSCLTSKQSVHISCSLKRDSVSRFFHSSNPLLIVNFVSSLSTKQSGADTKGVNTCLHSPRIVRINENAMIRNYMETE